MPRDLNAQFHWTTWPDAEKLLLDWIEQIRANAPACDRFLQRLERASSTRPLDWADHLVVSGDQARQALTDQGFEPEDVHTQNGDALFGIPVPNFPRVLLTDVSTNGPVALVLKCERVADVITANGLNVPIHGAPFSGYRQATVEHDGPLSIQVAQRCGERSYVSHDPTADQIQARINAREIWATRGRHHTDDADGMRAAQQAAEQMVTLVGPHTAASLAFGVERQYWQARNTAGQLQKARQDRLGFGWANHDHHTFRSSRAGFKALINILQTFGFDTRERFYAGEEAGWGAQVLEQPVCGLVVFADVDLSPEELAIDFASQQLPPRKDLGTVGLWCALHGESMLQAGMHHLEAQFEFDDLRQQLAQRGVGMMDPFSDMPHLRQAFTEGERWPVDPDRVDRLLAENFITPQQAQTFKSNGALGSHLENLQRREGFKGFNQKNVSTIIAATDPRLASTSS